MAEPGPALFSLGVFVAACFILSCGANQNTANQNRLASITLTPTTADAETFPDGQVQFTATGDYVNPPKVVTPLSATWLACQNVPAGPAPTTEVSVLRRASPNVQAEQPALTWSLQWTRTPPALASTTALRKPPAAEAATPPAPRNSLAPSAEKKVSGSVTIASEAVNERESLLRKSGASSSKPPLIPEPDPNGPRRPH
jgi:hypothetical protein